jgi:hypothetical protein
MRLADAHRLLIPLGAVTTGHEREARIVAIGRVRGHILPCDRRACFFRSRALVAKQGASRCRMEAWRGDDAHGHPQLVGRRTFQARTRHLLGDVDPHLRGPIRPLPCGRAGKVARTRLRQSIEVAPMHPRAILPVWRYLDEAAVGAACAFGQARVDEGVPSPIKGLACQIEFARVARCTSAMAGTICGAACTVARTQEPIGRIRRHCRVGMRHMCLR